MKLNDGKFAFLESENLYLRPLIKEDIPFILRWYNHFETRMKTGDVSGYSSDDAEKLITRKNADSIWFAVVRKSDDQIIGETGLLRMFPAWSTTDMSIIIPDEQLQHNGYGTETVRMMMNYAFGHLNFNRISIGVVGFNHKALSFYRKMGFKQEGIQEQGYYCNYEYHDFIMMRILRSEFMEMYKNNIKPLNL